VYFQAVQVNDDTKRATASLAITVLATNGNAPQFGADSYEVRLSEGTQIDTPVIRLTVTDADRVSERSCAKSSSWCLIH